MYNVLISVDIQKDFIDDTLGISEAAAIADSAATCISTSCCSCKSGVQQAMISIGKKISFWRLKAEVCR